MNALQEELHQQIQELILQLSEEQLVDLFGDEMIVGGYLSISSKPKDNHWENAHEWLKSYLLSWNPSEEMLEDIRRDIQGKIDYPDS